MSMIEVEKKFQPTKEQLEVLLRDSVPLSDTVHHDISYDFSNYKLFKKDVRLRNRNGRFELKIGRSGGVSMEIETKSKIEEYFDIDNLEEFVREKLVVIMDCTCKRRKYKNGDFIIDLDEMSFGYSLCEIELLVGREEEIEDAQKRILDFAKGYNFEVRKFPSKCAEYFRLVRPDIYEKLYGEKKWKVR